MRRPDDRNADTLARYAIGDLIKIWKAVEFRCALGRTTGRST